MALAGMWQSAQFIGDFDSRRDARRLIRKRRGLPFLVIFIDAANPSTVMIHAGTSDAPYTEEQNSACPRGMNGFSERCGGVPVIQA